LAPIFSQEFIIPLIEEIGCKEFKAKFFEKKKGNWAQCKNKCPDHYLILSVVSE